MSKQLCIRITPPDLQLARQCYTPVDLPLVTHLMLLPPKLYAPGSAAVLWRVRPRFIGPAGQAHQLDGNRSTKGNGQIGPVDGCKTGRHEVVGELPIEN
jgi:hypothetical protein